MPKVLVSENIRSLAARFEETFEVKRNACRVFK